MSELHVTLTGLASHHIYRVWGEGSLGLGELGCEVKLDI